MFSGSMFYEGYGPGLYGISAHAPRYGRADLYAYKTGPQNGINLLATYLYYLFVQEI